MILEVEFKKIDKALCMRVVRQSKRNWYLEKNKDGELVILSKLSPYLGFYSIDVRGYSKYYDKDWVFKQFPSNKARDAYHRKALRAIARARKEIK